MRKSTDRLRSIMVYIVIFIVLYLFYKSIWVITLLLPCIIVYRRIHRRDMVLKRKALLSTQFKDMLDSLVASLRSGYSIENALKECAEEITMLHGGDSPIYKELNIMLNQISMGISAEEIFKDLADRTQVEDIETFASVFSIAKRSGGDMVEIIKKTADDISAKIDTKNEIEVIISSKKLEQNIMMVIPIGIILYIDLTSGGLLDPLYGNLTGVLIMTACLIIYGAAVLLGRRITRIEV